MLTKFESKSARVKGLAFHPHRPWVCATLHNGTMQLWDYRVGTIIDRFEEHEGPVRGVDFHIALPLIVSGGDDYKVKVWDYKLRRCLFTLLGHLDYIRTVQFHPQPMSFPWILSASDDQTLRLWNYETRTCLSVLTGHNHYVMCASFHPSEDLIVSASLDQTVRVWDATGLRKKHTGDTSSSSSAARPKMTMSGFGASLLNGSATSSSAGGGPSAAMSVQAELFGTNDVIVKYVLEGHDRGVNWAAFHPTLPLIVSAADDRQVKLWRMSETKAWEVDTLRGHTNNVSCCLFHPNPKLELVISNSEDRSIRVWDVSKRVGVQTFRRESDRFWILAAHKTQNLLAAGHDSGMIVFKLERERPAYTTLCPRGKCYFVRGRELFCHEYSNSNTTTSRASSSSAPVLQGHDIPITTLRRTGAIQTDGIGGAPRFLYYNMHNPSEGNILVCSDVDGGSYELVTFAHSTGGGSITDGKRGSCLGPAVFLGLNRFAILDRSSRQIVIKNMQNETTKKVAPPTNTVEAIYDGGTSGRLLLLAEDRVYLFEVQSRRVLAEIAAPKLKAVLWSPDMSKVALMCKYGIVLADRQLTQLCSMTDTVRIKSGAWDCGSSPETSNTLFVYTTSNHAKYVLPSGDGGTLRALDNPIYVTQVVGDALYALDRESRMRIIAIDTTEAKFKLAVEMQKYSLVMEMVQHSRLCGKAIVGYLQSKGFPEVALHFVREPRTRFQLALACGDIETGMEAAFALEQQLEASGSDPIAAREVWSELGQCALSQGNHQVVEMSYQRTKDLDRLSFLYLVTGDNEKLRKMLKIASLRGDPMARYHTSLLLGDVEERVKVLEESGNWSLAYLCAKTHGLQEEVERLKVALETNGVNVEDLDQKLEEMDSGKRKGCLLQPPTPILRGDNWPTLAVEKKHSLAEMKAAEKRNAAHRPVVVDEYRNVPEVSVGVEEKFADDDALGDLDVDDGDAGWGEEDDDLMDDFGEDFAPAADEKAHDMMAMQQLDDSGFQFPPAGRPPASCWVSNSSHAADHLAAGSAASAMQLLNRQIAASNFSVLKKDMVGCYLGSTCSLPGIPGSASIPLFLLRNDAAGHPGSDSLPRVFAKMKHLKEGVRMGYRYFEAGKFNDSKDAFLAVLHKIPLVVVDNRAEANEIKEMLDVCREYITAVRLKAAMSDCTDPTRMTELSAYLTHCNLQPAHLLLALRSAMGTAFKHKNFIAAAGFAQRLLELPDMTSERNAELRVKVTKVLKKSEQMARNENTLNYKENTSFVIDCKNMTPIYSGEDCIRTSYSGSSYSPASNMEHKIDLTDMFCKVGEKTLGLVTGV